MSDRPRALGVVRLSKSSQVLSPITPVSLPGKPYEKPKALTGAEWEIVSRWEDFEAERAAQRAKTDQEAIGPEGVEKVPAPA
ncbi:MULTISPECIES: hypothetical protein [Streptomyces]|uniref:hypothetical protein n=1 Tax=Streptomyces TaxID=1883 RepID=UPI000C154146|nr:MULTISPECIES: hypothetical protein [Streptomyces]PIB10331.1 hypothetical protein B1C81_07490 [Streptomyces sp. HG99]